MSIRPEALWSRLSPTLKEVIIDELTTIVQEVIHDHIRTNYTPPPQPQGDHLHPPVQSSSADYQSGKPTSTLALHKNGL